MRHFISIYHWLILAVVIAMAAVTTAMAQSTAPATQPTAAPSNERPIRQRENPDRPRADDRRAAAEAMDRIDLVRDVVYASAMDNQGNNVELLMDCASPKQSGNSPLPAIIYIHGGGWSEGDKQAGLPFVVALADGGYFAATINYRLSGVAPYPAAVHDCKAAVRFIRKHADELGVDPDRIGVWGHSAGGHLSALLGTSGEDQALEGEVGEAGESSRVQCVIDISGPTNLERMVTGRAGARFLQPWLGGEGETLKSRAREASPVTHVDAGDPPFMIVHGTEDTLVSITQAEALRDALAAAKVPCEYLVVEGEGHMIASHDAYRAMAAFFDKHLGGHAIEAGRRFDEAGNDRPAIRPRAPQ